MMLYSYKKIYAKFGIEKTRAVSIAHKLQLPRIRKGVTVYFTEENAMQIINYKPIQRSIDRVNHRRKITIIEAYIEKPTIKGVSRTLRMNHLSVKAAIKEK